MNCMFCGDKLKDDTGGIDFSLVDSCQFAFYSNAYIILFFICDNRKIFIFDEHYRLTIEYKYPLFKREYDWIGYDSNRHKELEFVDRRIMDTGFIF